MPSGGKRNGAGRPKSKQVTCSLQIRVPIELKEIIRQFVIEKLKELKK